VKTNFFLRLISFKSNRDFYRNANYDCRVIFEKYESFGHLLGYYNKDFTLTELYTDKTITFKNDLKFGTNKKTIYRLLGKPLLRYNNPSIKHHTVLFYKFFLGIEKIKCEVHLYKDFFFLGIYIFDPFRDDFSFIKKHLFEKYLNTGIAIDSDVCIADKHNNRIFVNLHSLNSVITYVYQNQKFENELVGFIGEKKLQLERRKQRMMEKLLKDL
jgi:hypothetical protein